MPSSSAGSTGAPIHGPSGLYENDALDFVPNIVETVDHRFEVIVDLLARDESHWVRLGVRPIELAQAFVVNVVASAFDLGYSLAQRADPGGFSADVSEQRNGVLHQPGAFQNGIAHPAHFRLKLTELEQCNRLCRLLHFIDRVIHRRDQVLDVAAVERSYKDPPYR